MVKKEYETPRIGGAIRIVADSPVMSASQVITADTTVRTEAQEVEDWKIDDDFNTEWL